MQRRKVTYPWGSVFFVDDEEPVGEPIHKAPPKGGQPNLRESLLSMAGLPLDSSLHALGTTGPLVASRAAVGTVEPSAYAAKFGRDSLTMAAFLEPWYPELERATVLFWAVRQGRDCGTGAHEQEGAIVHEWREDGDEMLQALHFHGMHFPDYGSMDATPMWCIAAMRQIKRDPGFANTSVTNFRDGKTEPLVKVLDRSIKLIDRLRAQNKEGLIEASNYAGLYGAFPFWKDSADAYHHRDGTLAKGNVSSVEVMAMVYDTYAMAADLAEQRPDLGWDAQALRKSAADTRKALFDNYWVEDDRGGFFALGTDRPSPDKPPRKLAVRTSNMGYLLQGGILEADESSSDAERQKLSDVRAQIVKQLFSAELYCPAGIRTLAKDEVRFEPTGYHVGAVWPHDTFVIARALEKHFPKLAKHLHDVVRRDCARFRPEFLPGNDVAVPRPSEWVVRVKTVNASGDEITRSRAKVPEWIQGWAAAAERAAELSAPRLKMVIRQGGRPAEDMQLENLVLAGIEPGRLAPGPEFA